MTSKILQRPSMFYHRWVLLVETTLLTWSLQRPEGDGWAGWPCPADMPTLSDRLPGLGFCS